MQPTGQDLASEVDRSALDTLRRSTASLHAEIESHALLRPLLSPDISPAQLALLLCGFREFFALLEPGLGARLPPVLSGAGYRYHPRLPLLIADLGDLAETPPVPAGFCADLAGAVPGNLLGTLYVIEGATQGGRLIAPHLLAQLGLGQSRGARYFHLYRQRQWPVLRTVLAEPADGALEDIVGSAQNTFRLLHRVLDRVQIARQEHG